MNNYINDSADFRALKIREAADELDQTVEGSFEAWVEQDLILLRNDPGQDQEALETHIEDVKKRLGL